MHEDINSIVHLFPQVKYISIMSYLNVLFLQSIKKGVMSELFIERDCGSDI